MSDNEPNILEKAGMKVGDLIGRYLPEPDPDKGGHALNTAIVGVLVFTFVTLVASGLGAAIFQFLALTVYVVLGMYAGGPVFLRLQARRRPGPTTPPPAGSATPPPAAPDPTERRHRKGGGGNPFSS